MIVSLLLMNGQTIREVLLLQLDNLTAQQMVEEGDGLVILEEKLTEEPYGFAFAFGSEDLVEEINEILGELIENGTVEEIFASYGETYFKP